jgi:hypothetical protein
VQAQLGHIHGTSAINGELDFFILLSALSAKDLKAKFTIPGWAVAKKSASSR